MNVQAPPPPPPPPPPFQCFPSLHIMSSDPVFKPLSAHPAEETSSSSSSAAETTSTAATEEQEEEETLSTEPTEIESLCVGCGENVSWLDTERERERESSTLVFELMF